MQGFNDLAERILLSLVDGKASLIEMEDTRKVARTAVDLAAEFHAACAAFHSTQCELTEQEIAFLSNQQIFDTIKSVRERLGLDLKEARDFVMHVKKELGL